MKQAAKLALGGTLVAVLAVGTRLALIYRERNAPAQPAPAQPTYKVDDDDLVFLEHKRQSSLKDARELIGSTLWVSAGGQMDFYPCSAHHAVYSRTEGTLLAAVPLLIKDVFEQVAPKTAAYRVPAGDRQVLLAFTLPNSPTPAAEHAVPVGYREAGSYTFLIDEIFFYQDPHQLYKHWSPDTWKAIDEHRVTLGMNERQVQLALGQVSKSTSNDYGNRMVVFSNLGKPVAVTFVKNRVTAFRPDQGF
jgi:hypothetical protein